MDSKGLKIPVSESDKLEVSVLGRRYGEKAEHLPIKKRRFLFRTLSPLLNTASLEGTDRLATCLDSSSQEVQPEPDASSPPAASSTVADIHLSLSIDSKVDGEKLVKAAKKAIKKEDICGISLGAGAGAACSNGLGGDADLCKGSGIVSSGMRSLEAPGTVKFNANSVKLANISAEETDFHMSAAPSEDAASSMIDCSPEDKATVHNSIPYESTLDNFCSQILSESECSRTNQVASKTQNSAAWNDRLNWDLNTVMDAWEEPVECENGIHTADAACSNKTYAEDRKNSCKEGNSEGRDHGRECESASAKIGNEILPVDLERSAHKIEESELEEHKPGCADISTLLSPVTDTAPSIAVNKIKSLHNQHIDSSNDAIPDSVPSNLALEYAACDIFAKHVNVNCKNTDALSCPVAAGADFLLDCSIPPGFGPCIKTHVLQENVVPSTILDPAITTAQTTESEKHNLSLTTTASLENGVHHSGSTFDEDDKADVKKAITSKGITMENLVGKGTEIPQDIYKGYSDAVNQTNFGSILVTQSAAEAEDQPAAVSSVHDAACSDAEMPIKAEKSPSTAVSTKPMMLLTGTVYHMSHESQTEFSSDLVGYNKEVCEVPLDNGFGYENFPSDIQAGSEVDDIDAFSVGYDSQYEDGELRESSKQTWGGYEGEDRENEHGTDNKGTSFNLGTLGAHENGYQCVPEGSSRIRSTDVGSQRGADEISSIVLPEKLDSSDLVSGSQPIETRNSTRQGSIKNASQSDQWKINKSGSDLLPENQSSSSNVTRIKDFGSIKFSTIRRYGSETEDVETKAEGSRFYRRAPLVHIGEPSTRDGFLSRGRFQKQGCSSSKADDSASRSVRESGVLRSLIRGKYSPHIPASGRGGGTWNRSPGRDRGLNHILSPPYQDPSFRHSMLEDVASVDNLANEANVDPNDDGRPGASYITRQSFRSRLSVNREEDEFRARLGLRPYGDTCHNRFLSVGRGRSLRCGSRHDGRVLRGRYGGPAGDDYDEPSMGCSHPFPSRRRCFSPTERRENHPCAHHCSGSTSPSRSQTRSPISDGFRRHNRSPNLRSDARIRRPRSPNYPHGFEAEHACGYNNLEPRNNNSPPSSRWVNYKMRCSVFNRRSPPPVRIDPPIGERLSFYNSSRNTKQNENCRSVHHGRFSELDGAGRGWPRYFESDDDLMDHGHRRGGFVRHYDTDRPVKQFQYDEEDGYGPVYGSGDKDALEFHGRGNLKPYSNGTDGRFRDLPRRPREERQNW